MKIGLSATAVWTVNPQDEDSARKMLEYQPRDDILGYIQDALKGDPEMSNLTITAEELED